MDKFNLWKEDPEELLLEMGFGCEEPDLSGRIPARFISYQSQARGINLQVFLQAQHNRIYLDNPDVSNRFRQVEVLQQVTTAFSCLVGSSPFGAPQPKQHSAESQARRRSYGMLLRRVYKKSLSQTNQPPPPVPGAITPPPKPATIAPPPRPGTITPHPGPGTIVPPPEPGTIAPPPEPGVIAPPPKLGTIAPPPEPGTIAPPPDPGVIAPPPKRGTIAPPPKPGTIAPPPEPGTLAPPPEPGTITPPPGPGTIAPPPKRGTITPPPKPGTIPPQPESGTITPPPGSGIVAPPSRPGTIAPPPEPCTIAPPPGPGTIASPPKPGTITPPKPGTIIPPPGSGTIAPPPAPGMEVISFDETSVSGSNKGGEERLETRSVMSTNHSDSRASLEEPVVLQLPSARSKAGGSEEHRWSPASPQAPPPPPSAVNPSLPGQTDIESPQEVTSFSFPTSDQLLSPPSARWLVVSSSSPESQSGSNTPSPATPPLPPSVMEKAWVMGEFTQSTLVDTFDPSSGFSSLPPDSISSSFTPQSARHPSPLSLDSFLYFSTGTLPVKMPIQQLPATGLSSNPASSLTTLNYAAGHKVHCPPSLDCCSVAESSEHSPLPNRKDSLSPDGRTACDSRSKNAECAGERVSSSFQADKQSFSETFLLQRHSDKLEEGWTEAVVDSLNRSGAMGPSVSSSQSADTEVLIDPAVGKVLDSKQPAHKDQQQTVLPQEQRQSICSNNSLIQDCPYVEMDYTPFNSEDPPKKDTKQKPDKETKRVENEATAVSISDAGSSSSVKESSWPFPEEETEIHQNSGIPSTVSSGQPKLLCQMAVDSRPHQSPESVLIVPHEGSNVTTTANANLLTEIDHLDLVFETSIDGSDSETGDMQTFLQQLEAEGKVYWAEPVRISSSAPVPLESGTLDASDNQHPSRQEAASQNPSVYAADPLSSNTATPNTKRSGRSVSLQMPSSPSSHIVHRTDVPYMDQSKHSSASRVFPLDTSSPIRALQSWTLQVQRNALTKKILHDDVVLTRASDKAHRAVTSSPKCRQTHQITSDVTDEDHRDQLDSIIGDEAGCCCSWLHQWSSTERSDLMQQAVPSSHCCEEEEMTKSQRCEEEEMMEGLQQFACIFSDMEEQLCEDQAAVYCSLSVTDREMVREVEDLRHAVKQEAASLELLLNEVTFDLDASMKMKMQSLLEEQSLLCSQLSLRLQTTSFSRTSSRTSSRMLFR